MSSICPSCGNKRPVGNTDETLWKTMTCNCYIQVNLKDLYISAKIPEKYWYKGTEVLPANMDFLKKCLNNKKCVIDNNIGTVLFSSVNVEDCDYIAAIVAKEFVKDGFSVKYVTYDDIMADGYEKLMNIDLLILTNIHLYNTDFIDNKQYWNIVRTLNRKKPLILTSFSNDRRFIDNSIFKTYTSSHAKFIEIKNIGLTLSVDTTSIEDIFFNAGKVNNVIKVIK